MLGHGYNVVHVCHVISLGLRWLFVFGWFMILVYIAFPKSEYGRGECHSSSFVHCATLIVCFLPLVKVVEVVWLASRVESTSVLWTALFAST